MILIRQNGFHIFTLILFTSLIVHSWQRSDTLGWMFLFLIIMINAVLFILKKPISLISWVTIVIGILGTIMSMPELISGGIDYLNGHPDTRANSNSTLHPTLYFVTCIVISFQQILRSLR